MDIAWILQPGLSLIFMEEQLKVEPKRIPPSKFTARSIKPGCRLHAKRSYPPQPFSLANFSWKSGRTSLGLESPIPPSPPERAIYVIACELWRQYRERGKSVAMQPPSPLPPSPLPPLPISSPPPLEGFYSVRLYPRATESPDATPTCRLVQAR